MRKRYDFYSFVLIPALTLWMASGFGLTTTNFSVIGNQGVRRLVFLFWGALAGNYFYLYTDWLMERSGCQDHVVQAFLYGALLLLITAVGLPYLPGRVPGMSRLHVLLSFLSPVFLGIAEARFLMLLQRKTDIHFYGLWSVLGVLVLGAVVLLFRIGIVSSLLEIYLTMGVCLYLHILHRKIENM